MRFRVVVEESTLYETWTEAKSEVEARVNAAISTDIYLNLSPIEDSSVFSIINVEEEEIA